MGYVICVYVTLNIDFFHCYYFTQSSAVSCRLGIAHFSMNIILIIDGIRNEVSKYF